MKHYCGSCRLFAKECVQMPKDHIPQEQLHKYFEMYKKNHKYDEVCENFNPPVDYWFLNPEKVGI